MSYSATYSPDDNKLRLYAVSRLPVDVYQQAKAVGFRWAPMQKLFYATWSPAAADFCEDLAGDIEDEDRTLTERAADRADRFEGYSDKRAADAESARLAVAAIADNIPLGQPILIGHHSEKHARRDAARIDSGMRKAVKMWETSQYWTARAAGAIHHAKYKERPDVRARRIKTIEAALRKEQKESALAELMLKRWRIVDNDPVWLTNKETGQPATPHECAEYIANNSASYISRCYPLAKFPRLRPDASQYEGEMGLWSALDGGVIDWRTAQSIAIKALEGGNAHRGRWIAHYENRLGYERAMLADQGGTVSDRKGPEKGGAVRCWCASRNGGWCYVVKVNKVSITVLRNWGNGGENFTQTVPFDDLHGIMTAAEVQAAREEGRLIESPDKTGFGLCDAKPKPPGENLAGSAERQALNSASLSRAEIAPTAAIKPKAEDFEAMRERLKAGIQVQTVPMLFPTPRDLAQRMARAADIQPGHRILEPSAGTGMLVGAMGAAWYEQGGELVAVEINQPLARRLETEFPLTKVVHGDFLQCNGELGTFDRIVMNPPFNGAQDVEHILHALHFLKSGGRLIALCANGPRQRDTLGRIVQDRGGDWIDLPAGSFKEAGTGVNVAMLLIHG